MGLWLVCVHRRLMNQEPGITLLYKQCNMNMISIDNHKQSENISPKIPGQ